MRQAAFFLILFVFIPAAHAGPYDIKEKTPAVEQAISGRQGRYEELQRRKAAGEIGENRQGYVRALGGDSAGIAEAENADRRVLYQAIVDQNGLGPSGMAQVETAFGAVQREKARPGDPIENSSAG